MVRARSFLFRSLLVLCFLLLVAAFTHSYWMTALGSALVHSDGPAHADLAVVLAGDRWGHRITRAGDLIRQGYVPQALISGPTGFYGFSECDLAVEYAVKHGYPAEWFIHFPNHAESTEEEARAVVAELRRRNVHRYLVVTSNFHTARARRIFERMAPDLELHMEAAPDEFYRPDDWWRSRPARKIFLLEWTKTITGFIGM